MKSSFLSKSLRVVATVLYILLLPLAGLLVWVVTSSLDSITYMGVGLPALMAMVAAMIFFAFAILPSLLLSFASVIDNGRKTNALLEEMLRKQKME